MAGMFDDNPDGFHAQSMSAWMVRCTLQSRFEPEEPYWVELFEKLAPMAESLNLDVVEHTRIIWLTHTGMEPDPKLVMPNLDIGALV